MTPPKLYLLHENDEWVAPLRTALDTLGTPFTEWHLARDELRPSDPPPGIYYGKISASAHTRGHRSAPEIGAAALEWLESHGCHVINGSRAVDLEISKARQYTALTKHGIPVPAYHVVTSAAGLRRSAAAVGFPLIVKPNRGGKGAGVMRFESEAGLEGTLDEHSLDAGPDELLIVQAAITSPDQTITRCEFVGGTLLYAVQVDASGGFELCPADVCEIGEAFCATDARAPFEVRPEFTPPHLREYEAFLRDNDVMIAGIELIFDETGKAWTYDVNFNTNYNTPAETAAGLTGTNRAGINAVATFLDAAFKRHYPHAAHAA